MHDVWCASTSPQALVQEEWDAIPHEAPARPSAAATAAAAAAAAAGGGSGGSSGGAAAADAAPISYEEAAAALAAAGVCVYVCMRVCVCVYVYALKLQQTCRVKRSWLWCTSRPPPALAACCTVSKGHSCMCATLNP